MLILERQREAIDYAAQDLQQLRDAVVAAGQLVDEPDVSKIAELPYRKKILLIRRRMWMRRASILP